MTSAEPDDRTLLCAEFVLGTLSPQEHEQFLARLAQDPELQREVGYWQDRLLGLVARIRPEEPSGALWQRIEAALAATPSASPTTVPGVAAPPLQRPATSAARPSFWHRLAFWQGVSGLAVAASLLLAFLLVMRAPATLEPTYVAVLQTPDMRAAWIVRADDRGPVRIQPIADPGAVPVGKSWELWTKGKNANAPTSLGLLHAGALEIPRAALPYLGDEQLFEVSLEPEGGSPTGRPTGPVLFIGKAQRI